MTNKLHPQELADLLQCWVTLDDGGWYAWENKPSQETKMRMWAYNQNGGDKLPVTHAIAKPDDCPEWDKAIWEPRVMPERGQLCMFSRYDDGLIIGAAHIGYFSEMDDESFIDSTGNPWCYCKPIDSVPSRIDLDAQRSLCGSA